MGRIRLHEESNPVDATPLERLLADHDPPAVVRQSGACRHWLVLCDHASKAIPAALGDLGVAEQDIADHIGWDIGALNVARLVADGLDAPLFATGYSRLAIDCNRRPGSAGSIPCESDGRRVPGNVGLSARDRARRERELFYPYHQAISAHLRDTLAEGIAPAVISIHSCAPLLRDTGRPWEIGIAWNRDERMSAPVISWLSERTPLRVGANEPYTLDIGEDYTTPEHGLRQGLANLQVEFRQDCVSTDEGARRFASILCRALQDARADDWFRAEHYFDDAELDGTE